MFYLAWRNLWVQKMIMKFWNKKYNCCFSGIKNFLSLAPDIMNNKGGPYVANCYAPLYVLQKFEHKNNPKLTKERESVSSINVLHSVSKNFLFIFLSLKNISVNFLQCFLMYSTLKTNFSKVFGNGLIVLNLGAKFVWKNYSHFVGLGPSAESRIAKRWCTKIFCFDCLSRCRIQKKCESNWRELG